MDNLAIIGCGKMGEAVLSGLLSAGSWRTDSIRVTTPRSVRSDVITERYGVFASADNLSAVKWAQVVILAVKPNMVAAVLSGPGIREALRGKLLISLCAGVTLQQLNQIVGPVSLIRAMPNAPALVQQGMTVLSPGSDISAEQLQTAQEIFESVGRCLVLDERHIDAVTGLSGSGPAFVSVIMDAMADGGVMMGLPREIAVELVAQTCRGSAKLVLESGQHPAVLKDTVTTPAGCTIAGLLVLEDGKIRSTLARAIQEAAQVASGLGSKG